MLGVCFWANHISWQGSDLLILSIINDKVEMINISPERGMVNRYAVENMDLWIPNGMGWYPASRLDLIVKDDLELARKIVFFNFGFWPKYVIKQDSWDSNRSLLSMLGPIGWLRYRFFCEDWLWKEDTLKIANLQEIMPRDLADNKILMADIKINIVNATGKNGFGNMIADKLEWWGMTVTSVQTADVEKECRLYFNFNSAKQNSNFEVLNLLAKILNCNEVDRDGVTELLLGTNLEEMVKYSQTYVRSL